MSTDPTTESLDPYAAGSGTTINGAPDWRVPAGAGLTFTAGIVVPPDSVLGGMPLWARIEEPVTRAVVAPAHQAALGGDLWTVVLDCPLEAGAYELVWMTPDDPATWQAFVPITAVDGGVNTDAAPDWPIIDTTQVTPDIAQISRLMRTRTKTEDGTDKGVFDATTIVTADEVTEHITDAVGIILAQLPEQIDPELYPRVRYAVALQAAIIIEASHFRLQEGAGTGTVATYTRLLTATLNKLTLTDYRYVGLA